MPKNDGIEHRCTSRQSANWPTRLSMTHQHGMVRHLYGNHFLRIPFRLRRTIDLLFSPVSLAPIFFLSLKILPQSVFIVLK